MGIKLFFIKKFKANFIRFGIYKLVHPFSTYLIYLGYLARLGKWVKNQQFKFNDFYNPKVVHNDRRKMYRFVLEEEGLDGPIDYVEFGVGRGGSLRWWSENNPHPNSKLFGFDTYTGLPEEWGGYKAGTFSLEGNFPEIPDNRIDFVKGLFQDTLPGWLQGRSLDRRTVWHLDADLYTATIYVMTRIYPYLKKGDIIFFDEFGVPMHEFKAFEDFTSSYYLKLKPIAAINNYLQLAFKVDDLENKPVF